jgi:ClpP class serine protease
LGIYAEYLDRQMSFPDLTAERKKQLGRIAEIRGRDVLVYASDLRKGTSSIAIGYEDLLPITDQLSNLTGSAVDVILETPGGLAEVAEDIVRLLHDKYDHVAFLVPGAAKSAGTIMATAGDDILLEPGSSLGPIDAQLSWQGRTAYSADAFLKGLEEIKDEVNRTGSLNRAYIPILQNISPGEIQHAKNGLSFAKDLVTRWLAQYKFRPWTQHSSTGKAVTEEDREARAREIAEQLCDHGRWLSHGRSIKLADLVGMRLKITDYSTEPDLFDAIRRYHTLLQMTFDSAIYKVFETPSSQIYRFASQGVQPAPQPISIGRKAIAEVECGRCHAHHKLQLNLERGVMLEEGCLRYPKGDSLPCPECGQELNLAELRRQVEMQTKREVVLDD